MNGAPEGRAPRPRSAYFFNVVIQGNAAPEAITPAARRIVSEILPDVPARFRTIETVVSESVADRRFVLPLVGVFGGAAMLLATLGVYSVIAYVVTQRRKEIGLRVALGAQSSDVLRMVLTQGLTLAGFGIAIGNVAALLVARVLARFLFGVAPNDPVAFGGVIHGTHGGRAHRELRPRAPCDPGGSDNGAAQRLTARSPVARLTNRQR